MHYLRDGVVLGGPGIDEVCGEVTHRILDVLFPAARRSPIVTVLDGHPHTLSFLAGVSGTRIANLGVSDFGQVGDIGDLYRHYGIDTDTIIGAAWDLIDGPIYETADAEALSSAG